MKNWKCSKYTSLIKPFESKDLLLHNSFMGAVAIIPANYSKYLKNAITLGIPQSELDGNPLKELCDGGFFVPSEIDEEKVVTEILIRERDWFSFSMIILPHENCNFRCQYCYEKFEKGKMNADIKNGLKILVDHKAKIFKEIRVSWFGGEPLLAEDVIYELSESFINCCKEHNIAYSSNITTNGYLLKPTVVDHLLDYNVKGFQVTLDGPEHIHNKNRKLAGGGGTYKEILSNLSAMQQRKDDFTVRIRINFNDYSISYIESWLLNEISPIFGNDWRFALSFYPIEKWGGRNDSYINVCDPKSIPKTKIKFNNTSLNLGFSELLIKGLLMPHGTICYASKTSSLVIGSDGTVYKCTVAFDDPINNVGTLYSSGELIINHENWDLWTNFKGNDAIKCDECAFYPSCQSKQCPLTAIKEGTPRCPLTTEEYQSLVTQIAYGKFKNL